MNNSQNAPSRSLDVAGTETVNAGTYDDPNARLRLNGQGLPVALRRVVSLGQAGSFAQTRYQAVTPARVVSLSHSSLSAWMDSRSHPVN